MTCLEVLTYISTRQRGANLKNPAFPESPDHRVDTLSNWERVSKGESKMIQRIKTSHGTITVQTSCLGIELRSECEGSNAIIHQNLSSDQADALARAIQLARGMAGYRETLEAVS